MAQGASVQPTIPDGVEDLAHAIAEHAPDPSARAMIISLVMGGVETAAWRGLFLSPDQRDELARTLDHLRGLDGPPGSNRNPQ